MIEAVAPSPALQTFFRLGCRKIGPGVDLPFEDAFDEERTCDAGHQYRGAFCIDCERDKAGAGRG